MLFSKERQVYPLREGDLSGEQSCNSGSKSAQYAKYAASNNVRCRREVREVRGGFPATHSLYLIGGHRGAHLSPRTLLDLSILESSLSGLLIA